MTLLQLVLDLRQRLQDMRKENGTVITTISEDGIRWTSSNLLGIINDAFTEATRLIATYAKNPIMSQLANDTLIATTAEAYTDAGINLPASALMVTSVVNQGENDSFYGFIPAKKFYEYLSDSTQPRSEGKFFTVIYDTLTLTRKLMLSPMGNRNIVYTYVYVKNNYTVSDSSEVIPFYGIIDLVKDLAEREAREREHNWERSQILDKRIAIKLGINA